MNDRGYEFMSPLLLKLPICFAAITVLSIAMHTDSNETQKLPPITYKGNAHRQKMLQPIHTI